MVWKLADAKNQFSKVVDLALEVGPQKVVRRNDAVVVISFQDFERISGKKPGLKDYLMNAPSSLKEIDLNRDHSMPREIDL